jgi:hypothetical protein
VNYQGRYRSSRDACTAMDSVIFNLVKPRWYISGAQEEALVPLRRLLRYGWMHVDVVVRSVSKL